MQGYDQLLYPAPASTVLVEVVRVVTEVPSMAVMVTSSCEVVAVLMSVGGVTATADIVDFDSDTASDAETIDLNGFIKFADDGPSISIPRFLGRQNNQ